MTHEELRARYEAHRAVHAAEHDPAHGRLHGCCLVCGAPWPCEYVGPKSDNLARFEIIEPKHADLLRERDEARAELSEIRHIVTETLPDLADQPDRETTVRRVAALATRYQYQRDATALIRKDADRWEATSQAQAIEEHKLRAEVERLRAAPPVVNVTDIEAAARDLATRREGVLPQYGSADRAGLIGAILRKHTRPLDREGLLNAMALWLLNSSRIQGVPSGEMLEECADAVLRHLGAQARTVSVEDLAVAMYADADREKHYPSWETNAEDNKEEWRCAARTAMRYLGVQPTQPADRKPGIITQPKLEIDPTIYGEIGAQAKCPGCPGCPNDCADEFLGAQAAQPVDNEIADSSVRRDPSRAKGTGLLAGSPVPASTAQPVEPKPPEPAKVRVKLPTASIFHASDGEALLRRSVVVVLLREQGVEVDDDS